MSKASEQIARIQKGLGVTEQEAKEIYAADCAIDKGEKMDFDLAQDKLEVARKFAHTGTRKMRETGLNLKTRERKPNATKGGIISELATFLTENSGFSTENITITNAERQISFEIAGQKYELTLVQKRAPKK